MYKDLYVVGLTGGIASGKSTVAGIMRKGGIPVIDADTLGHMVLDVDGESYESVIEAFGREILAQDNKRIDRQLLGKIVFDNPQKRAMLEKITHPAIFGLVQKSIELIEQKGERLAIYEAALLVETGIYKDLDGLIVVSCSVKEQMRRLCARDGCTLEAAAVRIASQAPLEEKLEVADYVLENSGNYEDLVKNTEDLTKVLNERLFAGE